MPRSQWNENSMKTPENPPLSDPVSLARWVVSVPMSCLQLNNSHKCMEKNLCFQVPNLCPKAKTCSIWLCNSEPKPTVKIQHLGVCAKSRVALKLHRHRECLLWSENCNHAYTKQFSSHVMQMTKATFSPSLDLWHENRCGCMSGFKCVHMCVGVWKGVFGINSYVWIHMSEFESYVYRIPWIWGINTKLNFVHT